MNFLANAEHDEVLGLSVTLMSPASVKDMKIVCKDGECKIDFHELSFVIPHKKLPFSSFFVALEACAENIKTASAKASPRWFSIRRRSAADFPAAAVTAGCGCWSSCRTAKRSKPPRFHRFSVLRRRLSIWHGKRMPATVSRLLLIKQETDHENCNHL